MYTLKKKTTLLSLLSAYNTTSIPIFRNDKTKRITKENFMYTSYDNDEILGFFLKLLSIYTYL